MTYLEKLEAWVADQRENHGLVDLKFFPRFLCVPGMEPVDLFPEDPLPTTEEERAAAIERLAEQAYKLLTGETPSRQLTPAELEEF